MSLGRVTDNMLISQALRHLHANLSRTATLQQRLATGKEFSRPVDDPTGFAAALDFRARLAAQERYLRNIERADSSLALVESNLRSVNDVAADARELVLYAGDAAVAPAQMAMIAEEIHQLFEQLLETANSRDGSGYLFAGARTDQAPFRLVDAPAGPSVEYLGDEGERLVEIASGALVGASLNGLRAFLGRCAVTGAYAVADPAAPLAGQLSASVPPPTSGTFSINGVSIDVDPAADSLSDLCERINRSGAGVAAEVDSSGRLVIESLRSAPFQASSGTSNLLESLGLFRRVDGVIPGAAGLETSTPLADLGVVPESLRIAVGGDSFDLDLSSAVTLGDVLAAIDGSGAGVRAYLNRERTGIDLVAVSTVASLEVRDLRRVFGADLGTLTRDTSLAAAGVVPPSLTAISIENAGATVEVDLSAAAAIGDVIDAVNASAAGVTAVINPAGTGIDIVSDTTGHTLGPLAIAEVGAGTSAAQLGILGSAARNTASDLGIAGDASLDESGGTNLFQTLLDFEAALRAGGDPSAAIARALRGLDAALDANSVNLADIGARVGRLELSAARGEENRIYLAQLLSNNEDVDIAEVMTRFSLQQAVLQASLNATARVLQPTLLDFLR